jgi:cystathionine beta-lyase/cystathionine gamma-synthase
MRPGELVNPYDPYMTVAGIEDTQGRGGPVVPPIYQTSNFWSSDPDEFLVMATQPRHAAFYTRYGNPTVRLFENAVAELEGAEAALAMASGMAAMTAAILTFVGQGQRILAQKALYGGTIGFLRNIAPRFGILVDFFDQEDFGSFSQALKPDTRLLILESPSNPLLRLTDIRRLTAHAKTVCADVITLVDNTVSTPLNQRPLSCGADLAMHSATKSLGGHSDISGGILAGSVEIITSIWRNAYLLGATMDPFAAWLALRGVRTLPMRVARHNQTADAVAARLERHPGIKAVHYPGLASHPQHDLYQRQMGAGAGGLLSFEVDGGMAAAETVMAGMKVARRSASFGSFSSFAVHPAAMWSGMMSEEQLRASGLPLGLIRLGVGFEDPTAIAEDIEAALACV